MIAQEQFSTKSWLAFSFGVIDPIKLVFTTLQHFLKFLQPGSIIPSHKPQAFFRSNLARLTKCIAKVINHKLFKRFQVTIKVSDIICFVLAHWIPEYQTLLIDDVFF